MSLMTCGLKQLDYANRSVAACVSCPHFDKASCTGGQELLSRLGQITTPLRGRPVVVHLRAHNLGAYLNYLDTVKRIRLHTALRKQYPQALDPYSLARLRAHVGRYVCVAGHPSNVLVTVIAEKLKNYYQLVTCNTHSRKYHHTPWVTRMEGYLLNAACARDHSKLLRLKFRNRDASKYVPLVWAQKWAEDYADRSGGKIIV